MYGKEWEDKVLEQLNDEEKRIYFARKKYLEENGYYFNPDTRVVVGIVKGLYKNLVRYGAEYCPCRPVTGDIIEDTKNICPCVYHFEELRRDGICKCRLFVTKEKAKEIIKKHGWNLKIEEKV